jgi:hypothetical protein
MSDTILPDYKIMFTFFYESCPYDALKVYDFQKTNNDGGEFNGEIMSGGGGSSARMSRLSKKMMLKSAIKYDKVLLDLYCGRKLNITLFSTNNILDIEFEMSNSLGNEEYAEDENRIHLRKGFKAFFKFSKYFADLSFITGTHVPGTSEIKFLI